MNKKLEPDEHWIEITDKDWDREHNKSWWDGFITGSGLILICWLVWWTFNT